MYRTTLGKIQPFFEVSKRRYRFRVLDGGPSRFYEIFVTNPDNPSQVIPFWVIADDGNLLPRPVQVTSFRLSVAERYDIIIDFNKIARDFGATRLWLENRLEQVNGRAPTDKILPAGRIQNALVELRIVGNGNNNVMLLRPGDGALLATAPAGEGPFGLIATVGLTGTPVWTANFGADTISRIGP